MFVIVCVCLCMCLFQRGCVQKRGGVGGGAKWQELWCRCPHSQWSLMNGNCCDGDGEMRWRPFLRTPVIWMAGIQHGRKDKLVRALETMRPLYYFFSVSITLTLSSLDLNYSPSVNIAAIFILFNGFIVKQVFHGTVLLTLLLKIKTNFI